MAGSCGARADEEGPHRVERRAEFQAQPAHGVRVVREDAQHELGVARQQLRMRLAQLADQERRQAGLADELAPPAVFPRAQRKK